MRQFKVAKEYTLSETAEILGMSRLEVRRLESSALWKLRRLRCRPKLQSLLQTGIELRRLIDARPGQRAQDSVYAGVE